MKRRNFFIFSCLIVVSLALAPFPGRWGVLKDLLPILSRGLASSIGGLGPPVNAPGSADLHKAGYPASVWGCCSLSRSTAST